MFFLLFEFVRIDQSLDSQIKFSGGIDDWTMKESEITFVPSCLPIKRNVERSASQSWRFEKIDDAVFAIAGGDDGHGRHLFPTFLHYNGSDIGSCLFKWLLTSDVRRRCAQGPLELINCEALLGDGVGLAVLD
jgi:hypothetical protein